MIHWRLHGWQRTVGGTTQNSRLQRSNIVSSSHTPPTLWDAGPEPNRIISRTWLLLFFWLWKCCSQIFSCPYFQGRHPSVSCCLQRALDDSQHSMLGLDGSGLQHKGSVKNRNALLSLGLSHNSSLSEAPHCPHTCLKSSCYSRSSTDKVDVCRFVSVELICCFCLAWTKCCKNLSVDLEHFWILLFHQVTETPPKAWLQHRQLKDLNWVQEGSIN